MRRLLLLAAILLAPALCWGQNTTVTATVTDSVGAPYTNSTGYAALVCPQNQAPLLNGYSVPRTFPIVAFDSTGTFTQQVYDVSQLTPAGCGYQWHIVYQDGATNFITGLITSVTGTSVNESTAISAYSVLLPTSVNRVLVTSFTTTAASSDNVTLTGMTSSGHCSLTPTNATASGLAAVPYISAKTTNQVTVTHSVTSGATFDILCTSY